MEPRFIRSLARALLAAAAMVSDASGGPRLQAAGAATAVDAAEAARVASEIERLRGLAAGVVLPDQLKGEMTRVTDGLTQARADLDAGRVHLAWWRLSSVMPELTALQAFAGTKDEAAAFESERARVGNLGEAAVRALADPALARAPAARRAQAEAALNVVSRFESSGSAFARASQPRSGIYYLHMARGHLEFGTRSAMAEAGSAAAASMPVRDLPSLEDRLRALEQAVAEAYAKPGAGLAQHPRFIALSATLKEARELDAAGLRHGALYKYLDGRRRLHAVSGAAVAPRDEMARRLEAMRTRLSDAPGDHGIGWLFWEMAAFNLEGKGDGGDERHQRAAAVLDAALPEYFEILDRRSAPAASSPAGRKEEVRLTLVRWPYT
jgi:hypothetical protein